MTIAEPPAPVLATIEKTVQYVLKNGASFEAKLKQNDAEGKFAFLEEANEYHKYYKSRLEGTPQKQTQEEQPTATKTPSSLNFLTALPPISAYDLDVLKLTALYVSCNSDKHADTLQRHMDRRGKRGQFAFLGRNHTLHALFQSYVKQYRAVISCSKNEDRDSARSIRSRIASSAHDLYQLAYDRAVYDKKHKIETKTKQAEIRKAQLHYASIDWQDFAFVAKVNFDAVDEVTELAAPLLREDIMYRALQSKSREIQLPVAERRPEVKVQESKEDTVDQAVEEKKAHVPKGMKIRAAGESRLKRKAASENTIQCPITGEQIAELKFDNHLKVLLRDPRYKEQQDNFMRKNFTHSSNLTTDQVYENIKRLVRKRGLSEEEEAASKRLDIGPSQE